MVIFKLICVYEVRYGEINLYTDGSNCSDTIGKMALFSPLSYFDSSYKKQFSPHEALFLDSVSFPCWLDDWSSKVSLQIGTRAFTRKGQMILWSGCTMFPFVLRLLKQNCDLNHSF